MGASAIFGRSPKHRHESLPITRRGCEQLPHSGLGLFYWRRGTRWRLTRRMMAFFAANQMRRAGSRQPGRKIAKNGARSPDSSTAQQHYRAAVILLNPPPEQTPINSSAPQELSEYTSIFSYAGYDANNSTNYFEATGGRGSITMGGLSQFRKTKPGLSTLPASFGKPPPPQYCVYMPMQNGVGGFVHHHSIERGVRPRIVAHANALPQCSRVSSQTEDDGGWLGELQERLKARADRDVDKPSTPSAGSASSAPGEPPSKPPSTLPP